MRSKMMKIIAVFAAVLASASCSCAAEQRAFSMTDRVTVHAKPDESSKSWESAIPGDGTDVPSAVRDKSGALWLSVTLDGKTGWIHSEGIRLRMGGRSKFAASAAARCAKLRESVMNGEEKTWAEGESFGGKGGIITTLTRDGGVIQLLETASSVKDIYFAANGAAACEEMLGFNAIGMHTAQLRAKVGTPTVRETPVGERSVNILSYESDDGMTLSIVLRNDSVESVSLYAGETGTAGDGFDDDVLSARELN